MQSLSCSLYRGCFIFLLIFILLVIPDCTSFSASNPHHQHPSPTIHQIATNHHDEEEEPIILSISNIFTKVEIDDMLQLIDSNESVLTPTLTYQEDVFSSKEAWDAEDSTLRRIVQPLLDDGTILIDDDSMNEKDGALRTFVYVVTNHPDRILQEDIIIGANIIQRRETIERWKSDEGLSIMKLSMDYDMMIQNKEGVDTIDWDAISLGKRYEVPNKLLEKIEQYVIPSIFKEESSTRNTSSAWTTIDATIVKYSEGDLQVPHIDPCDATLLICLQPSIEGGSTCFPLLNPPLRLENRRGGDGYLFFSSKVMGGGRRQYDDGEDNDNCSRGRERNALSLRHGGRVTKGNKIVIQLMLKYSGVDDLQTWLEVLASCNYSHNSIFCKLYR